MDLYPACAEEMYSDVIIILCDATILFVLYGFVSPETGIARDSHFLGLSQRCRGLDSPLREFGPFQLVSEPCLTVGRALGMVVSIGKPIILEFYINSLKFYIYTLTDLINFLLTTLTTLCRWKNFSGTPSRAEGCGPAASALFFTSV